MRTRGAACPRGTTRGTERGCGGPERPSRNGALSFECVSASPAASKCSSTFECAPAWLPQGEKPTKGCTWHLCQTVQTGGGRRKFGRTSAKSPWGDLTGMLCLQRLREPALRSRSASLWSLWSFNERHTAARTFLGPMDRNAVVSTAAGAGPGAIAGFDTDNPDRPLLGEPPSSSRSRRDQQEQNKTGCAYSPSPVCPTHVPQAAPHGVCVGPLNYHSGSYPHTPLLGQWRGSASDAQASQEAKDSSSSQGQPERDPRSASGRHLGDQR
mmetsp:Transcript_53410/g.127073  ORF Transcript_53410/g.127073 Transcript_53410/m.127073 type:complete len:269 (+) Transcript_53410:222-1028(+)